MRKEGKNGQTTEEIKSLLESGKKPTEIAKLLCISRQAVYQHIDKLKGKKVITDYSKKEKKKYFINWHVYNDALVKRGEFILCFDLLTQEKEYLQQMNRSKEGKKFQYSDALMDICRVIKAGFKLDFRTSEGICKKLFFLFELNSPDYTTMCKRFKVLRSEIKEFMSSQEREIAADGTGRSQSKRGDYRQTKYKVGPRTFIRVSITVDVKSKQVTVSKVDAQKSSEIKAVKSALQENLNSGARITRFYADKLHDSKRFRADLISHGIEAVIPARNTTTPEQAAQRCDSIERKLKEYQSSQDRYVLLGEYQRLKTLIECATDYDAWRDRNSYGKRSIVENTFSRDTLFFGDSVSSKILSKADKEVKTRYTLLNIFMALAKCNSKRELNSTAEVIMCRLRQEGGVSVKCARDQNVLLYN